MKNGNFIDFIISVKDNEDLYTGFLSKDTPEALAEFFKEEEYDVPLEDCKKLMKAKGDFGINGEGIPPAY